MKHKYILVMLNNFWKIYFPEKKKDKTPNVYFCWKNYYQNNKIV